MSSSPRPTPLHLSNSLVAFHRAASSCRVFGACVVLRDATGVGATFSQAYVSDALDAVTSDGGGGGGGGGAPACTVQSVTASADAPSILRQMAGFDEPLSLAAAVRHALAVMGGTPHFHLSAAALNSNMGLENAFVVDCRELRSDFYLTAEADFESRRQSLRQGPLVQALLNANANAPGEPLGLPRLRNDLQDLVAAETASVQAGLALLKGASGAMALAMSGSGPSLFALFADQSAAALAQQQLQTNLQENGFESWVCSFLPPRTPHG